MSLSRLRPRTNPITSFGSRSHRSRFFLVTLTVTPDSPHVTTPPEVRHDGSRRRPSSQLVTRVDDEEIQVVEPRFQSEEGSTGTGYWFVPVRGPRPEKEIVHWNRVELLRVVRPVWRNLNVCRKDGSGKEGVEESVYGLECLPSKMPDEDEGGEGDTPCSRKNCVKRIQIGTEPQTKNFLDLPVLRRRPGHPAPRLKPRIRLTPRVETSQDSSPHHTILKVKSF